MSTTQPHYDAIIIGAGFGGIRALHECRKLGLTTHVYEAGTDVGGTWYWNRYPGARTDSESWCYCYKFDEELLRSWDWKERMPGWKEVLEYLRHVVDKHDMRRDMEFQTRIRSAHFDEKAQLWKVTPEKGEPRTCRFLISAAGVLTVPFRPAFPGIDTFKGQIYQSTNWPRDNPSLAGKRVALVGTGATGVQIIPVVAQVAKTLTVFQRTPNYVMPGRNHLLEDEQRADIRANYDTLWSWTRTQPFAFPMAPLDRMFDDYTPEEQQRIFDGAWETGGFRFIFESFADMLVNPRCNEAAAEYIRNKIRTIVKDQRKAEILCPQYQLGLKRPPLGHFYYEAFNRPNVDIVDVKDTPIERITEKGLVVDGKEYEADVIIFATGFDAGTGALTSIDLRGRDNRLMKDAWKNGAKTNLGITVDGFPNLFIISGPQTPFANIPVVIDAAVDWISAAMQKMRRDGKIAMEATPEAVESWVRHVENLYARTVMDKGDPSIHNWMVGNNVPGKARTIMFYFGGAGMYFQELNENVEMGFPGFEFSAAKDKATATTT
jgi:cation diffusion facilitator CzcD-associated flavoprotein CzcO